MELIKNLPTRIKNSYNISYAIFLCLFCFSIVIRRLEGGKRSKSCGCVKNELISKSNKGKKKTEEHKQKLKEVAIGRIVTEETRDKLSKATKGENNPMYNKHHTEEARQKQAKAKKGKKRTEVSKSKQSNSLRDKKRKPFTEEHRKNMSEAQKGKHCGKNNNFYGIHFLGELSPNWQGGLSFLPYPPEFNKELKQSILERDKYTCQNSACICIEIMDLHIHHIDYDKKNNNSENLTTLCNSCHSQTNGKNNREYWINYYQNIMISKIEGCLL